MEHGSMPVTIVTTRVAHHAISHAHPTLSALPPNWRLLFLWSFQNQPSSRGAAAHKTCKGPVLWEGSPASNLPIEACTRAGPESNGQLSPRKVTFP